MQKALQMAAQMKRGQAQQGQPQPGQPQVSAEAPRAGPAE